MVTQLRHNLATSYSGLRAQYLDVKLICGNLCRRQYATTLQRRTKGRNNLVVKLFLENLYVWHSIPPRIKNITCVNFFLH